MIKKIKKTVPWIHLINDLNEEVVGTFYKKELQNTNHKYLRF